MNRSSGKDHYRWKGGISRKEGYILIKRPNHHGANSRGYIFEHRLVYEEFHKCSLLNWTIIHHKNGILDDNRPENLEPMTQNKHLSDHNRSKMSIHINTKCSKCGTNKTLVNNKDRPAWLLNEKRDGYLCWNCHHRRLRREGRI
jgi:hypothetical protein